MLKSLSITNYALIDNLEIKFPEGLIIITGETGAGKSILLGALSLLLGSKADSDVLKNQEKNCVVEGIFRVNFTKEVENLYEEEGIEKEEMTVLRRVIYPGGKTRSFVNDSPVSAKFLKFLSSEIIDIHAQHQHLLLSDSNFQMKVFDSYCRNSGLLDDYTVCYSEFNRLGSEVNNLKKKIASVSQESDYDNFVLNQLKEASLKEGELEALEEEFSFINNSGEIRSALDSAFNNFNSGEIPLLQHLREASQVLSRISNGFVPASELSERIESCRIELKDIETEIIRLGDSIDISPDRASFLDERISLLYNLMKRHKKENISELITLREELENRNSSAEELAEELERSIADLERADKAMKIAAKRLQENRMQNAEPFSLLLRNNIRDLEMPHADFKTEIIPSDEYSSYGTESVQFLFSANKNIPVRELGKIASGGEVSRIMLCLKVLNANIMNTPTMIFDEIDTGVSGSIADKMGNLLVELSKNLQIFAITHLPQIASKGRTHLLVYKDIDSTGTTKTMLKEIRGEEREREIARLLSGSELSAAAFENARVLLKKGN